MPLARAIEHHTERMLTQAELKFDVKGKRIAIIDITYTGRTLNEAAQLFRKSGASEVIKVALWPKSRIDIYSSTYFLWADALLRTNEFHRILLGENWHVNLLKQVMKNK